MEERGITLFTLAVCLVVFLKITDVTASKGSLQPISAFAASWGWKLDGRRSFKVAGGSTRPSPNSYQFAPWTRLIGISYSFHTVVETVAVTAVLLQSLCTALIAAKVVQQVNVISHRIRLF